MNGWIAVGSGIGLLSLITVGMLLRHVDRLTRLVSLESDMAVLWAEIMGRFSSMRLDFGNEAAIEWLDAGAHEAMDDLQQMMNEAEKLIARL